MKKFPQILSAVLLLSANNVIAQDSTSEEKSGWDVNNPPGQWYDVNIDTNKGTWMNVDVSPDGKTLVFDLLGDIYTLPISGGEAKALTHDIAWQMQPTFSPDGKTIAFTSDQGGGDNIWVMNVDGSDAKAVTEETFRLLNSPAWSPDGEYLLARKHFTSGRSLGAGEVWMYHRSGGAGVKLTARPNDQKDLGEPAFSPDGQYVYFSQDDTPGKTFHYSKDSVQGIYKIKRYDRQNGDIEVLISGLGGAIRPTPSPDGKTLAYISRDDFQSTLYLYDLASGKKTKIYGELERDMQETWAIHGVYPTMEWLPDNRHIVLWAGGELRKVDTQSGNASVIPFHVATTKKVNQALRFPQQVYSDEFPVKMLRNVQISPNGKQVVFEALGYIWLRDLASDKPRRLTKQTDAFELYPSFSRDGKKLVYTSWRDDKQGAVHIASVKNGKSTQLVSAPGKYVEPVFSPDGNTVVYRKVTGGYITPPIWDAEPGLYRVATKGGKPELITENGMLAHFAADNAVLYYMGIGEQAELWRINLDGQDATKLYQNEFATEYRVSPDGKLLAYAERFKVFVTPLLDVAQTIQSGISNGALPVHQLSLRAGENISWQADSKGLYWSLGPDLYQASVADVFNADKSSESEPTVTSLGFSAKADKPKSLIALTGATIATMKGNEVITDGVVLVQDNRIAAVGKRGDVTIPADAKVVDMQGKTILPGMIDAHAHGPQGSNEIIPQQNWVSLAAMTFGVTTVHDPSNDTTEFFTASEMQKAGEIVAPRLYSTGTILYGAKGIGYTSHIDSLDDAKFHLERLKAAGAFSVKSYNQPRRNQRQQVIEAGRQTQMMVVPEGGSLFQHNMTMVVDGHTTIEHAIPLERMYDDVIQLWSQARTAYTPTLVVAYGGIWGEKYWYSHTDVWKHPRLSQYVPENVLRPVSMRRDIAPEHHYNHIRVAEEAKKLHDAGVYTNIGSHGQREGLGAHWELWMYVQGGMTPLEAFKTATIDPARTFGLEKELGSIEVGKLADLMIIDGEPLKDIRQSDRVSHVMQNGRLFDAASMNQILPTKTSRQPLYFKM